MDKIICLCFSFQYWKMPDNETHLVVRWSSAEWLLFISAQEGNPLKMKSCFSSLFFWKLVTQLASTLNSVFNMNKNQEMSNLHSNINTRVLPCFMEEAVLKFYRSWNWIYSAVLSVKHKLSSGFLQKFPGPLRKFLLSKWPNSSQTLRDSAYLVHSCRPALPVLCRYSSPGWSFWLAYQGLCVGSSPADAV